MLSPCDVCWNSSFVDLLKAENKELRTLARKIEQIYAQAPVSIQAYLLLEFQKAGIIKQDGKCDAE